MEQKETNGLVTELEEILKFFHGQNLYYYEAWAAITLASALFAEGKRKEMLMPVQRALDLAARFDYEYFLREEIKRNPALFRDEEVIERLPLDLREAVGNRESKVESQQPNAILSTLHSPLSTVPIIDSGIDATHADLPFGTKVVQNVHPVLATSTLSGFTPNVTIENIRNIDESVGHGTHCAGIVGGSGVRSGGLFTGVAPGAKLVGAGLGAGILVVNPQHSSAASRRQPAARAQPWVIRLSKESLGMM